MTMSKKRQLLEFVKDLAYITSFFFLLGWFVLMLWGLCK